MLGTFSRRRLFGLMPALPFLGGSAAMAGPEPGPKVHAALIDLPRKGPCELLIWTPEQWAALAPADRPHEARPMSGGAFCLCRVIAETPDLDRLSPDPAAAVAFEAEAIQSDINRLEPIRDHMGEYRERFDKDALAPLRARLARAKARLV